MKLIKYSKVYRHEGKEYKLPLKPSNKSVRDNEGKRLPIAFHNYVSAQAFCHAINQVQ